MRNAGKHKEISEHQKLKNDILNNYTPIKKNFN